MQINLEMFNEEFFLNYLNFLIGQLYKGLCLKEESDENLIVYLNSLKNELIGSKELISFLKYDARFLSLISKIQFLITQKDVDKDIFKKEIFASISIIKKIQVKYFRLEEK